MRGTTRTQKYTHTRTHTYVRKCIYAHINVRIYIHTCILHAYTTDRSTSFCSLWHRSNTPVDIVSLLTISHFDQYFQHQFQRVSALSAWIYFPFIFYWISIMHCTFKTTYDSTYFIVLCNNFTFSVFFFLRIYVIVYVFDILRCFIF